MISVKRDYQSGIGDKFKVTASDKGFGRWSRRNLTLEAALETVKHYYGVNHDKATCVQCATKK